MKKTLTALLCAMLICFGAAAESPSPTPTPEPEIAEAAQTGGSMSVTLNAETLTLDFDPDPQYSICRDGFVQASFYAYGAGDLLYELYMTFPQAVQPGEIITPDSSLLQADLFSGLYLYTSTDSSEVCSAATQFLTGPYPEGSDYTFTFSDVSLSGTVASFAGTIEAKLVQLDQNYNPSSAVDSFSAQFDFSMDLGNTPAQPEPRQPESSQAPSAPEDAPAKDEPKSEFPYPLPDMFINPYPPTPPSKLITPANAQKI